MILQVSLSYRYPFKVDQVIKKKVGGGGGGEM